MEEGRSSGSRSLVASTSPLHEDLMLEWRIDSFRELVDIAIDKQTSTVARLPFEMGATLPLKTGSTPSFSWLSLLLFTANNANYPSSVSFFFEIHVAEGTQSNLNIRLNRQADTDARSEKFWADFNAKFSVTILDSNQNETREHISDIRNLGLVTYFGFANLLSDDSLDQHLDDQGALTLKLKISLYLYDTTGEFSTSVLSKNYATDSQKLHETIQGGLISEVGSLLGDQETSDVRIAVVDENNGGNVLKEFYCHTPILAARSSVFRAMFRNKGFKESKEGVVRMTDASVEVVDQFLTFLYSGRLKNKRSADSDEPLWVKILPDLVQISDKYDLRDLREFCDINFHRNVSKSNAAEMYQIAIRFRLVKAQAKLRTAFSNNLDVLLESISA